MSATKPQPKRACDSCHRRKVKCNLEGNPPCKNCIAAGLNCTFNAIPQKKGPKGARARVIQELREGQARSGYEAHYLPPYTPGSSPNGSPNQVARNLALLPNPLLEACKAHYYGLPGVYPTQPILPLQQFTALVQDMRDDNEAFCLVTAFCANAIIQGGMKDTPELGQLQGGLHHHGIRLLSESLRFRHAMLPFYRSHPTHLLLLTSWFYYGCYYTLGSELGRVMGREVNGEKEAWMQLKETIAQAELLGMQNEVHRHTASHIPNSGLGVLFWLLLIAERDHGFHDHRNISLYATPNPPLGDEITGNQEILNGFELLIRLYRRFDHAFFEVWNRVGSWQESQDMASLQLALELQQRIASALPAENLDYPSTQICNLRITQQWLQLKIWQLCHARSWLQQEVPDIPILSRRFPTKVAQVVMGLTQASDLAELEVHGAPLMKKIFDIASCIVDVAADPQSTDPHPRIYMSHFLSLFAALRQGNNPYCVLLRKKIRESLPQLKLPPFEAQNMVQISTRSSSGSLSTLPSNDTVAPFSGFPEPRTQLHSQMSDMALTSDSPQQSRLDYNQSQYRNVSSYPESNPHQAQLAYRTQHVPIAPHYQQSLGDGAAQQHYNEDGIPFNNPALYGRMEVPTAQWVDNTSVPGEIHAAPDHMYPQNAVPGAPHGQGYVNHGHGQHLSSQ